MKLDFSKAIKEIIEEIEKITKKQEHLNIEEIKNLSRYEHHLALLQDLHDKELTQQKAKEIFNQYYKNTHRTTSFVTAPTNSEVNKKLYDIVSEIGNILNLSPFSLIFPNLEITDEEVMYRLDRYEDWMRYQKDSLEKNQQTLIDQIVQRYMCGEKTLVEKKCLLENFLLENVREQLGKFNEVASLEPGQSNKILLSSGYKLRIEQSINDSNLRTYLLLSQPNYDSTFKGALEKLSDRLCKSGVRGTGATSIAGPDALQAILDFELILKKYEPIYREKCRGNKKYLEFLDFLCTKKPKNGGLLDASCVDTKSTIIKDFLTQHGGFLDKLDPPSAKKEQIKAQEQETKRCLDAIRKKIPSELLVDNSLSLDISSLKEAQDLELDVLLRYAEFIPMNSLEIYFQKNNNKVLAYNKKLKGDDTLPALLSQPRHFALAFNVLTPQDQDEIIFSLQEVGALETVLNHISDKNTLPDNKAVFLSLLPRLVSDAVGFDMTCDKLPEKDKKDFLAIMSGRLPSLIKDGLTWSIVRSALLGKDKDDLYLLMKNNLPSFITEAIDYNLVHKTLAEKDKNDLYALMSGKFSSLIRNGYEYKLIYDTLSEKEKNDLYALMSGKFPSLIRNGYEYKLIYDTLSEKGKKDFYLVMSGQLPSIMRTGKDYKIIYDILLEKDKKDFRALMREKLLSLIKDPTDLFPILSTLSLENEKKDVVALTISAVTGLIKDKEDFAVLRMALKILSLDERKNYLYDKNNIRLIEQLIAANQYQLAINLISLFSKEESVLEKAKQIITCQKRAKKSTLIQNAPIQLSEKTCNSIHHVMNTKRKRCAFFNADLSSLAKEFKQRAEEMGLLKYIPDSEMINHKKMQ